MLSLQLLDDLKIRGLVAPDKKKVFSVYDFLSYSCDYEDASSSSARKAFKSTMGKYRSKLEQFVYSVQFPGPGQRLTPAMTAEGLQMLLMTVKGAFALAFRNEAFKVLQRYINGDSSLCKEIDENKVMGKDKSHSRFSKSVMENLQKTMDEESRHIPTAKYVYGMESPEYPGLIKIGKATDVPSRLCGLNTGRKHIPLKIIAFAPTYKYRRDEKLAHAFFASKRREGEFFKVTRDEVRAFFTTHIMAQYQVELAEHVARVNTLSSC
jgi:hypothetical protein